MLEPVPLLDPNVLVLCVVAVCYLLVKALALYDRIVDDADDADPLPPR